MKTVYNEYCSWYINSENVDSQNTRQQWQQLVHKYKNMGADIVSYNWGQYLIIYNLFILILFYFLGIR